MGVAVEGFGKNREEGTCAAKRHTGRASWPCLLQRKARPKAGPATRKQSALIIQYNLLFVVLTVSHVNETIAATK